MWHKAEKIPSNSALGVVISAFFCWSCASASSRSLASMGRACFACGGFDVESPDVEEDESELESEPEAAGFASSMASTLVWVSLLRPIESDEAGLASSISRALRLVILLGLDKSFSRRC